MTRGYYDAIIRNEIYESSDKEWNIELQQSDMVWYDLVVNEHETLPFKDLIIEKFRFLNKQVKENLEKRFVYFIASRRKVRFSQLKKPRYSLFKNRLYIFLEIGREKNIRKVTVMMPFEKSQRPTVEVTDKFITFTEKSGDKHTASIHDFLLHHQINIGVDTFIHYVGKTKIPERRPLDGSHKGLSKILYSLSNEDNDIFIFYNLFKIMVDARNNKFNFNFTIPNSMTNEIDVEKEGDILEKSLILHFSSSSQLGNIDKELGELRNNLIYLAKNNNIKKITMGYEVDDTSEYYKFGSSSIKPKYNHSFCLSIKDGLLVKENLKSFF